MAEQGDVADQAQHDGDDERHARIAGHVARDGGDHDEDDGRRRLRQRTPVELPTPDRRPVGDGDTPRRRRRGRPSARPRQERCGGSVCIHAQTSSTCRSSAARSPELSITRSASSQPSLPADLLGHPGAHLFLGHRPVGDDPLHGHLDRARRRRRAQPSRRRRVGDQRDVEDDHLVRAGVGGEPPGDLGAHRRVDDGIEVLHRSGVAEHERGQLRPVERAVGGDDLAARIAPPAPRAAERPGAAARGRWRRRR